MMVNNEAYVTDSTDAYMLKCTRSPLGEVGEGLLAACKEYEPLLDHIFGNVFEEPCEELELCGISLCAALGCFSMKVKKCREAIDAAEDVCALTFSANQENVSEGQPCHSPHCTGVLVWSTADEIAQGTEPSYE